VLTNAFGCYQLHLPSTVWIDIEAAAASVSSAERALAEFDAAPALHSASTAAAIARRVFLPGEEGLWVEAKRAELAVVLRRALDCISDAALALGDLPQPRRPRPRRSRSSRTASRRTSS